MDSRLAASIAGAAATVPMTAAMLALSRALPGEHPEQPLPPEEITEHAAESLGFEDELDKGGEPAHKAAALTAHFGVGAAAGAAYIPFAGKSGMPPALEGALYGLAVWGASYLGLGPATGLYRSATEDPVARNVTMVAAHLVWGAALGVLFEKLDKRA